MKPLGSFRIYILAVFFLFMIAPINKSSGQTIQSKQEDTVSEMNSNPLYMLTYDHGGLVLWGTEHFARYLRSAITWLDRYPDFKIGLDNEAYTYDYLKKYDTVLLGELRGYLKKYDRRFGIGTCTYGQPLSQFINEESNIRQIAYALETDKATFNCAPDVYLMSEHAMHSQIPQILNGFGFKGAIMRTHFMMYGYNPCYHSAIGWWIGLDGSWIPAIPTYKGEGSGFGFVTEDNLILTRYPGPECNEPFEDFQKKFSDIHPLLATRADDSGLRQEGLVKEYEGKPGYKWVLLEEIFTSFPPPEDLYKTLPNDFHVRMPWGYCGNEIWNMSRQTEIKVLTAERLATLVSLLGGQNYETALKESWKNLLVAQHHDIQICGILSDSRKFLPASMALSDSIIQSSMKHVSSQMQGGKLAQITVFNPLSWTRKEWINVTVLLPQAVKNISVHMGDNPVPFEILSSTGVADQGINKVKLALQIAIPALTFQSYSITSAKSAEESGKTIGFDKQKLQITTPFWIISLNAKGGIASITSRISGKQMIRGERNCYFAGVINGETCESTGTWDLDSIRLGSNQIELHEDGSIGNIPYRLNMTLNNSIPRIDFNAKFHFNEEKIGRLSDNKREVASAFLHEEKLRFKLFPALGIGTTGIRDLPFAIAETEDKYIEGNYWTALADGHSGMAIFNRGNMGSVHETDESISIPLAYSMFYVWKTVILQGDYTYEFALYPFEGRWMEAGLHQKALEYNFPCITSSSIKGSGKSGNQIQLFDLSSPNVILSAFYLREGKPIIRFYESQGIQGQLQLKYLPGKADFTEVNLAGDEKGTSVSSFLFQPWQIKSFQMSASGQ